MKYSAESSAPYRKIANYAILCIAFLICVFNPYALYRTDITQFDSTQTLPTLCALFGAFLITSFIAIYATSFIPKKFAKIPAFAFSLALFIGLIYSFILVGDYGAMDHFSLQKTPFFDKNLMIVKAREFIAVFTVGIIFITLTLKKLLRVWQMILVVLFIVSTINTINIILQRLDSFDFISETVESNSNSNKINAPYQNELFSYSKTQKNIIVIVLDMFSGSHTPYILEQFPHLKAQLDGFILFPNAISTTNATIHSIATLIGGEYYAVYNMNARKLNLEKEIDRAFIETSNAFAENGFSVSLMAVVGSNIKNIRKNLNNNIFAIDANSEAFRDFYIKQENLLTETNSVKHIQIAQLLSFGLFKFVPEFPLRGMVYNNGNWLLKNNSFETFNIDSIVYAASFYSTTHNVNTNANKPTFKFIHSMMTHLPYGIYFNNNKCNFFSKQSVWNEYPHKVKMYYPSIMRKSEFYQHYDTEVCALHYLAHFVEMLKKVDIYNNTQIFVVSDHSGNDNINIPILDKDDSRPDALFLFKDFGARGAIHTDNRLMANYDIASIFCANIPRGCPSVGQNILEHYPQNREIIHIVPKYWELDKHKNNEWILKKTYMVKGNIYDEKNWEEVKGVVNME